MCTIVQIVWLCTNVQIGASMFAGTDGGRR